MNSRGKLRYQRWIISQLIITVHVFCLLCKGNTQPTAEPPAASSGGTYMEMNPTAKLLVGVFICAFFAVGFVSVFIRGCANFEFGSSAAPTSHWNSAHRRGRGGLDLVAVESFPIFEYSFLKNHKIGKGVLECAVCLLEFEEGDEKLRLIPVCSHVFHAGCIDQWLLSRVTCPVCRAKLTTESGNLVVRSAAETVSDTEPVGLEISLSGKLVNQPTDPNWNPVGPVKLVEKSEAGTECSRSPRSREGISLAKDQVAIEVEEVVPNTDQVKIEASEKENRPPEFGISGEFQPLGQLGERIEKITLRLP